MNVRNWIDVRILFVVPFLGSEGIPALHSALCMASGRRAG